MARKEIKRSRDLGREAVYLVALYEMGRPLASIGSSLTGDEKTQAQHVYGLLDSGLSLPSRSPVTVDIAKNVPGKPGDKYTRAQLIKEFAKRHPRLGIELKQMASEKITPSETRLRYARRDERGLEETYFIEALARARQIPIETAERMYNEVISPLLEIVEEEQELADLKIKV